MTDTVASAEATYLAALEAAAAPTKEATEMRAKAREQMAAADAADGPERIAARRKLQQFRQTIQIGRIGRPVAAPTPAKPAIGPS